MCMLSCALFIDVQDSNDLSIPEGTYVYTYMYIIIYSYVYKVYMIIKSSLNASPKFIRS